MKKIAIIGAGISGLTCAWKLAPHHKITLIEKNHYVGGHTHTVNVAVGSGEYEIDTGFIVCNDRTYPNFLQLLREWQVPLQNTGMSFSVACQHSGLEYNGTSMNSLFAQRSNIFSPRFWSLLWGIVRFNRAAKKALAAGSLDERMTLGQFLSKNNIRGAVVSHYIAPMTAAIWSTPLSDVSAFPLAFFLRFCANHGLFDLRDRPQWYVIKGGSHAYVKALLKKLKAELLTGNPVQRVTRQTEGITLQFADGTTRQFDDVIFACHSDEALAMLGDPTPFESSVLSAIKYQENEVILHTDAGLLPRAKRAWAAWNYLLPLSDSGLPTVTYNMNVLQQIDAPETFCVTLNRSDDIAPEQVLGRYRYAHPQFTAQATRAQQRHNEISGVNRSHYCGAYWRYGFHEDGVVSALRVCQAFGISH